MKRKNRCSTQRKKQRSRCRAVKEPVTIQPFPSSGPLGDNFGMPLPVLKGKIRKDRGRAYSYVLSTVGIDNEATTFEQHGSAPNFQGGVLTLCTCKHQMRATQSTEEWVDVWIAGFTSRTILDRRHWLFYLAKIESAHGSHTDLWKSLKANVRNAKAANRHFLGDIFTPKSPHPTGNARYSPSRYVMPTVHAHRRDRGHKGWHNDINYYLANRLGHPALLVADPKQTYLWNEPTIYFSSDHCRNYHSWQSLSELLAQLREAK